MALVRIGKVGAPIGTPRRAADMPLPGQTLSPLAAPAVAPGPERVAAAAPAEARR